ncbi:SDR family oxidoreductase [Plantibacter sp. YIM 135347]|uniref:SDR family oxidoreductase n=1 Tax=Plantibacter sp. YIM 135347 TaxID=3423919 RepID=UPI003D340CEE
MHVFITGASGWVGSTAVDEFIAAGHAVTGLVRSAESAEAVSAKGATALRGDLDDLDSLRRGAADADAVVHLANKHDWANPAATNLAERTAVQTLGDALAGSGRAFVVASALAGIIQGRPATEADVSPAVGLDSMRGGSENLTLEYADRDVRASVVRLAPSVHGLGDRRGFIPGIVRAAEQDGTSAYIGDGENVWAAVHASDAARLIRLAVERAPAGSRLHAVAEEGVSTRAIAEAIGAAFSLPVASIPQEAAAQQFGPVGRFFGLDLPATAIATRTLLDWTPTGPTLFADIASGAYSAL